MGDRLTRREIQCLRLAGQDLGNKAIARQLLISPSTVENHLTSAYAKLGTSDRRQAAERVFRDYPEFPQSAPTPMVRTAPGPFAPEASGDEPRPAPDVARVPTWFLPAPPRPLGHRLGIILMFAALAGVVTTGIVSMVARDMTLLASAAPPAAVLTLDSPSSARPQ
jgi:DNA-binding CsgD family transcriptional regulator